MPDNYETEGRHWFKYSILTVLAVAIISLNLFFVRRYISSNSDLINDYSLRDNDINTVRDTAVAGLFYPADYYQLESSIKGYLQTSDPVLSKRPHIIVVPHAGYIYSAKVAAKAYQHLLPFAQEIKKVILVGPAHQVVLKGAALSSATDFKTPLGLVPTDKELTSSLVALPEFKINDKAHKKEHSLEVQLPFLQKTLNRFSIVPIVYGRIEPEKLAAALRPYLLRNDTLLVISADLSHYLDNDAAQAVDSATAQMVASGRPLGEHQSCGATGINTAMLLAKSAGLRPQLLDMANSGDATGNTDSVVGYASWMFTAPETAKPELSPLEQEVENLSNFARHNRENILNIVSAALQAAASGKHYEPSRDDYPDVMFDKGAAFITLSLNGELRGCIGSLLPHRAIAIDLAENSYAAAREDSRFVPLTPDELKKIGYSISLLSGYEPVSFVDEEDLLTKISAGTDGLVLRDGDRQGLFLPSVWKQFPDKKEFLNNLKIKAGLSPSYWSAKVKIVKFRTVEITQQ